jgi:HEAT repeat protein
VRALFRALDDPDPLVQSHAAGLLASVPHAAAIRTLRALLADEQTELIAAAILATVGDESSEERIISVLADVHEPPERRWIAARSAIHIDDDRARQALRDALADGDLVDAWRESDSAGDVPRLLELAAASPSEELRAAASAAQERITAEAGAHEDLSGDVADLVDPDPHIAGGPARRAQSAQGAPRQAARGKSP